jgi:radical SAM protein with 4Fe4S-binding SPASM domain
MKYFDYFGSGGNIHDQHLSDIYNSPYFNNIRQLKDDHNESCTKCHNYGICQSGCLGQKMVYATALNGDKTLEWYEVNAKRTMNNFNSREVMQLNAKMGIAGETGELIDCMKKLLTHNCSDDHQQTIKRLMIDEIGDIIWYIASSLSTFYQISFNEIGKYLLKGDSSNVTLVDGNMIKHCTTLKDPECPYANFKRGYSISHVDNLIKKDDTHHTLLSLWERLDVVSFKLRRSETKEDIIKLSSELIVILGHICHSFLDTTLEDVLIRNIIRLQERYPMGFDSNRADKRIDIEEIYKTDQMTNLSYLKK